MSGSGRLLVLLVSSDSETSTASLEQALAQWCAAGLLGDVVCLTASETAGEGPQSLLSLQP